MHTVAATTKPPGRCCQREGHTLGPPAHVHQENWVWAGPAWPPAHSVARMPSGGPRWYHQATEHGAAEHADRAPPKASGQPRVLASGSANPSLLQPNPQGVGLRAQGLEHRSAAQGRLWPAAACLPPVLCRRTMLCSLAGPSVSRSSGSPLLPPRALCIESVP